MKLFSVLLAFSLFSCEKDSAAPIAKVCDVKGLYQGTSISTNGNSSTTIYRLRENNFAVGTLTPTGAGVTFGGYRNTCDSVIISAYYNANNSYYLLQGRLSLNKDTISGTFKNLTNTSDFGIFKIFK